MYVEKKLRNFGLLRWWISQRTMAQKLEPKVAKVQIFTLLFFLYWCSICFKFKVIRTVNCHAIKARGYSFGLRTSWSMVIRHKIKTTIKQISTQSRSETSCLGVNVKLLVGTCIFTKLTTEISLCSKQQSSKILSFRRTLTIVFLHLVNTITSHINNKHFSPSLA